MTERASKQQRMDQAFAALLSDDDAQILGALTRIDNQGDARAIRPLLNALARTPSDNVKRKITEMLYAVKAKDAVPELVAALEEPALAEVRRTVLATFWNAGLDARDHLDRLVTLAIEGDADECFECLTIVENQEIWPEKSARLGLARLRKAVEAETDSYKGAMLKDMVAMLEGRLGVD